MNLGFIVYVLHLISLLFIVESFTFLQSFSGVPPYMFFCIPASHNKAAN